MPNVLEGVTLLLKLELLRMSQQEMGRHFAAAGVRLRNNEKAGPFPEGEDDTEMPFVEAQVCAARADPEDEFHKVWTKMRSQALAESPPAQLRPANQHTGWRDPFLFEIPTPENDM